MKKTVFFGAGNIGAKMLELWREFGIEPDFFCDNNMERWGSNYHNIQVLSLEELVQLQDIQILITCNQVTEIWEQLLQYKILPEHIFVANTYYSMLRHMEINMRISWRKNICRQECKENIDRHIPRILFDLQYGTVLGGVESWVFQMADKLSQKKLDIKYITLNTQDKDAFVERDQLIMIRSDPVQSSIDSLRDGLTKIRHYMPCNIVCNFPFEVFEIAVLAKWLWPQDVNLITVVHCDERVYYEKYSQIIEIIDYCLVTCDKMEKYFIEQGMEKEKLLRLTWEIPYEKVLERTYLKERAPIRIGYAGRIVNRQKRLDLLIVLVAALINRKVDFQLNIAGNGEFKEELQNELEALSSEIYFKGHIERKYIADFWREQDIAINCSDYEGRCISRGEAMASGAVPVVTDTSGATADVVDGYNGYIVPVGDIDSMTERICYLYDHRNLLELMGVRSRQKILIQNSENDLDVMWSKVVKRWE